MIRRMLLLQVDQHTQNIGLFRAMNTQIWIKQTKRCVCGHTCACDDCCELGECNVCCMCCGFVGLTFVSLAKVVEFRLMFGFARPSDDGICIWFVCIVSKPGTGIKSLSSYWWHTTKQMNCLRNNIKQKQVLDEVELNGSVDQSTHTWRIWLCQRRWNWELRQWILRARACGCVCVWEMKTNYLF